MNIYVGNLSQEVTEKELREAFGNYGQVTSAKVMTDRFSGASKGFGFVLMPNNAEADSPMKGLNGEELKGRELKISEARQRSDKRRDDGGRRSW